MQYSYILRLKCTIAPIPFLVGRLLRNRSLFPVDLSGLADAKTAEVRELYSDPRKWRSTA